MVKGFYARRANAPSTLLPERVATDNWIPTCYRRILAGRCKIIYQCLSILSVQTICTLVARNGHLGQVLRQLDAWTAFPFHQFVNLSENTTV
jgi:hypothetical protein